MRGRCQHISLELPHDTTRDEAENNTETDDHAETDSDRSAVADDDNAETDDDGRVETDSDDRAGTGGESAPFTRSSGPTGEVDPELDDPEDTDGARDGVADLARQYAYLEDVESELSLAQRWVHGRVTDILDSLSDRLGSDADSRFHAEVLAAIARGNRSAREIAGDLHADPERVETALDRLSDRGLVDHDGQNWTIR